MGIIEDYGDYGDYEDVVGYQEYSVQLCITTLLNSVVKKKRV